VAAFFWREVGWRIFDLHLLLLALPAYDFQDSKM
jgi:hypothetical protein